MLEEDVDQRGSVRVERLVRPPNGDEFIDRILCVSLLNFAICLIDYILQEDRLDCLVVPVEMD